MTGRGTAEDRLTTLESDYRAMTSRISDLGLRVDHQENRVDKLEDSVLKFNTAATVLIWLGGATLAVATAIATGWSALGGHGGK